MTRHHAHRIDDRPRVTADDVRQLVWLLVVVALLIAICAVDPTQAAAR